MASFFKLPEDRTNKNLALRWTLLGAGFSDKFSSAFGLFVNDQENIWDIERTISGHFLAFIKTSPWRELITEDSWDCYYKVFGVEQEVRETFEKLRHEFPDIMDAREPKFFFSRYISAVWRDLTSDDRSRKFLNQIPTNGTKSDDFKNLSKQTINFNLSSSKNIKNCRANIKDFLSPFLKSQFFSRLNQQFWYHGFNQAAAKFMERNGINVVTLRDEPRHLDANVAFYFTSHFEHALYQAIAKSEIDENVYVMMIVPPKTDIDNLPGQIDLRKDNDELKRYIQYNSDLFHQHAPESAMKKWKTATTSLVRGYVVSAHPQSGKDNKLSLTNGEKIKDLWIQPNAEQICFLDNQSLNFFSLHERRLFQIYIPEKLNLRHLRKWALKRVFSVSTVANLV